MKAKPAAKTDLVSSEERKSVVDNSNFKILNGNYDSNQSTPGGARGTKYSSVIQKVEKKPALEKELRPAELEKKQKISSILDDINDEIEDFSVTSIVEAISEVPQFDILKMDEECQIEARTFLRELALIFIDEEEFKNDRYLQIKIKEDLTILQELKYQAKISKYATQKLLENISADQLYYKNYESIRFTQQSVLEIIRHIVQLENIMEDYYRTYFATKLRLEADLAPKPLSKNKIGTATSIMTSKDLLNGLGN